MTIETLPSEVLVNVFSYLPPKELTKTSTVSRLFQNISSDEALWRFRAQKEFTQFYQPRDEEKWKETYKSFYLKFKASQKEVSSLDIGSQLYTAIVLGCEQKLSLLLEGSDLDINQIKLKGKDIERSLLHLAVEKAHPHVVDALLERGADPNARDKNYSPPLHEAACIGCLPMVKSLIEKGADPNARDRVGRTPLHYAAYMGTTSMIQLLIEKGADKDARDQNNCTPLHLAAHEEQNQAAMEVLIERGADLSIRNTRNETPLQVARKVNVFASAMHILSRLQLASVFAVIILGIVYKYYLKQSDSIRNE